MPTNCKVFQLIISVLKCYFQRRARLELEPPDDQESLLQTRLPNRNVYSINNNNNKSNKG